MSKRFHVKAGYCNAMGTLNGFCVLDSGQCGPGQGFTSTKLTDSAGFFRSCTTRDNTEGIFLGACGEGCASDETSCDTDFSLDFGAELRAGCTMKKAAYGDCDGRCVWSANDCSNSETYGFTENCTCDQVQVGACQGLAVGEPMFCAVSPGACDPSQEWRTIAQLAEQDISCYLCRGASKPQPVAPKPDPLPLSPPTMQPTSTPTMQPTTEVVESMPLAVEEDNNVAMIGGIVGGVAAGLLVLIGVLFFRRKRKEGKPLSNLNPDRIDVENEELSVG
uniref:Uncharacterized protein n=1 Tax=Proboscia inermis TaxID=420281 RepID=A0A7S0CMH6_9STRA|mmetsp:Transcript_9932/g.10075  ORF Transcript_9932/g.10075 Transcript_9932/m.10075 type:complete len:277 (+) Transcript_9932:192-1022(+)